MDINMPLPRVSSLGMSRHSVTCPISDFPTRMEKGIWQMGQKSLSEAPSPVGSGLCGQRVCDAVAASWSLWPRLITEKSPWLILTGWFNDVWGTFPFIILPDLFTDVWGTFRFLILSVWLTDLWRTCPLLILPVMFIDVWETCPLLILPSDFDEEQLFFLEVFLEWLADAVFFFFLRGLYSQMSSSLSSVWGIWGPEDPGLLWWLWNPCSRAAMYS